VSDGQWNEAALLIPWLGHAIEVATVGLFGWCWVEQHGQARGSHSDLLVAVLYGWLLETLDMWVFGTYHYEPATWWWIGHVPFYIPLLWATILHSSMGLSDRTSLPHWARPFLDGLLAVLIDLAIDAIAIRVGLWRWKIPLNEGWFGVPAGNLCAWMWVAAWYGAFTRFVRQRIERRGAPGWHRLLIPLAAYTGLFSSLWLVGAAGQLLGLETQNERLWLFTAHLVSFLIIVTYASRRRNPPLSIHPPTQGTSPVKAGGNGDRSPREARSRWTPTRQGGGIHQMPGSLVWNRWLMHASFSLVLWWSGVWRQASALILVSGGSMLLEWWAQRWCTRSQEHACSQFLPAPGSSAV
jgi:hypothetical protein